MKNLRMMRLGILFTTFIVLASCAGTTVRFDSKPDQKYDATIGRTITAEACGFQLLLVIPIEINGRAQRAYSDLISQAGGAYVTDIKVQEKWYYAFVGTVYCTELEATAYPKITAAAGTPAQQ